MRVTVAVAAEEPLTDMQVKDAVALGKDCGDVPLVKVGAAQGDFNVFVEGAFARIAVHAAAARQMHQPFDTSKVKGDLAALDYRVWVQYSSRGTSDGFGESCRPSTTGEKGASTTIRPVRERPFQLTVGRLPGHGIIDEVRLRRWEWMFDRLPAGEFQVILDTSAGTQRYTVTARDRADVDAGLHIAAANHHLHRTFPIGVAG